MLQSIKYSVDPSRIYGYSFACASLLKSSMDYNLVEAICVIAQT